MSEEIRSELLKDEEILWEGQPSLQVNFTKGDLFLVPFSILWEGFVLFWEYSVLNSGAPVIFPFFGALFIVFGLYFVFGRFIYKRIRKSKTYYAVTNKRVIALVDNYSRGVDAEYIDRIPCINKTVRPDGIGSLVFGNGSFKSAMYANSGMEFFYIGYSKSVLAFYDIEEADNVYRIINEIRNR